MGSHDDNDELVNSCVQLLVKKGIRVCAFDMDQTAVAAHSQGRLERGVPLQEYLSKATVDFLALVPRLHQHGIGLAIATHSDEEEFGGNIQRETHILGQELASTLVATHFPTIPFHIVAYNPRVRKAGGGDLNAFKRYHMREIMQHFDVLAEEIVFLDDDAILVEDCQVMCGVHAIHVDPSFGFRLLNILQLVGGIELPICD